MKLRSVSPQSGSTLAVVITIMAILMVTVGVAFQYTTVINRNAQRSATLQTATSVADSAIEVMFNSWRAACRGSTTLPTTNNLAAGGTLAIATPSPFPNQRTSNFVKRGTGFDPSDDSQYNSTYVISNYKVIATTAEYTNLPNANSTPEPQLGQVSGNTSSISPTTSATYNYIASADVTLPERLGISATGATTKNVVARVRRVFSKQQLSPWNWAIFYNDPLEIHPGPQFTVTGWVHTNADLYTGHNTLTFADKVTYAGDWYHPTAAHPNYGFMPGDGQHPETPSAPNWLSNLPPAQDQEQQPFGIDTSSMFSMTDNNPNNDSYHELIDPPLGNPLPSKNPANQYYDPLMDAQGNWIRYYDQAAVIIQVSDNPSTTTPGWDGVNGHDIVNLYIENPATAQLTPISSASPNNNGQKDLYNMFATSGAITTNESIQDNREGANVGITTLDLSKIVSTTGTPSYNEGNKAPLTKNAPVVYIYNTSATSSARRGIRIKGGSVIPSAGLTVASPNPVYIQGDFNTGGTGSLVPSNNPSNFNTNGTYVDPSNPPQSVVSGYTRAPSSVVADAVNILSNSWNDALSGTVPTASPTTVNTAIVSGTVPTNVNGDNAYSGGAENFPRFLEDWSNQTFTYYGSMVELYKSQQAIGEWGKANVYSPPTREWYFDSNFKTNPPPGTIMIYNYLKGRWSVL
jgi:hypothetical protein